MTTETPAKPRCRPATRDDLAPHVQVWHANLADWPGVIEPTGSGNWFSDRPSQDRVRVRWERNDSPALTQVGWFSLMVIEVAK